jgi:hypothetical protein
MLLRTSPGILSLLSLLRHFVSMLSFAIAELRQPPNSYKSRLGLHFCRRNVPPPPPPCHAAFPSARVVKMLGALPLRRCMRNALGTVAVVN